MSWSLVGGIGGGLAALFGLTQLKTSRPDGTLLPLPAFRRMLITIMPTRNESVVYFDRYIRAEKLEAFLAEAKDKFGGNMTHAVVAAVGIGLAENPRMNQFVVGRRLYARKGRWISFSMKRKKLNKEAKISAVKLEMRDGETFRELCERVNGGIKVERSGKRTSADKEHELFDLMPRFLLNGLNSVLRLLDYNNLLPGFFIRDDAMYTSAFVANLGSLGMGAGYHHLYEHGTCPLFIMIGQVETKPVVEGDKVVPGRVLHIRFSYEERIADGLTAKYGIESVARVLEDPYRWLGCVGADGSDTRPMWPHGQTVDVGDLPED